MPLCTKKVSEKGFSLVELLVSLAIFSIIMTTSIGTLLTLVDANRKARNLVAIINAFDFSLDSMSRTIRTGSEYHCADDVSSLPSGVQNCISGAAGIVVTNSAGTRVGFRFTDNSLERRVEGGDWVAMTSGDVSISEMKFYVRGTGTGDNEQPFVTIALRGETVSSDTSANTTFDIQTSLTQRLFNE